MSEPASGRDAALATIRACLDGKPLQEALDFVLSSAKLARRDRDFCANAAYGYFRQKIRLDFTLDKLLANPKKTPPGLRLILGLACCSLLFQDGAPDYAVIDEAVSQARREFGPTLAKVANGVLRSAQRRRAELTSREWFAENAGDDGLALWYSLPPAVFRLWRNAYGEEAALALARRSIARPWSGVRPNPASSEYAGLKQRLDQAVASGDAAAVGRRGYAFPQTPDFFKGKNGARLRAIGAFSFQGAGSLAVLEGLGIDNWRDPVWDCCAGFGGKTTALLEAGVPVALASDPSRKRLRGLVGDCARLSLPEPFIVQASAIRPPLKRWDGHILADVPCSGLGVLARRPDLRLRAPDFAGLIRLQKELLRNVADLLAPGRELAYLTCALNPAENEEQIAALLADSPGLELAKTWQTPIDHPWLEGMFGALIRRNR